MGIAYTEFRPTDGTSFVRDGEELFSASTRDLLLMLLSCLPGTSILHPPRSLSISLLVYFPHSHYLEGQTTPTDPEFVFQVLLGSSYLISPYTLLQLLVLFYRFPPWTDPSRLIECQKNVMAVTHEWVGLS